MGRRGRVLTRGCTPQDGVTPLLVAAANGHLPVVRFLVEKGADITAKTNVSGMRVGGERQWIGENIFRGKLTAFGGASNTCQGWTTAFWRRQMMACRLHARQFVVVEGLLLHK
jgi:hypothetical protein